ncbi:hypothetical protein LY76DRAFT_365336 [Colletotrichum caudatum]|nr:hypothetical protein LY76DRAFT_365336 [Colletotrichum caudatum]
MLDVRIPPLSVNSPSIQGVVPTDFGRTASFRSPRQARQLFLTDPLSLFRLRSLRFTPSMWEKLVAPSLTTSWFATYSRTLSCLRISRREPPVCGIAGDVQKASSLPSSSVLQFAPSLLRHTMQPLPHAPKPTCVPKQPPVVGKKSQVELGRSGARRRPFPHAILMRSLTTTTRPREPVASW